MDTNRQATENKKEETLSDLQILKKYLKYNDDGTIKCIVCNGKGYKKIVNTYGTIYSQDGFRKDSCYCCGRKGSIGWTDLVFNIPIIQTWILIAKKQWEEEKRWKYTYTFATSNTNTNYGSYFSEVWNTKKSVLYTTAV